MFFRSIIYTGETATPFFAPHSLSIKLVGVPPGNSSYTLRLGSSPLSAFTILDSVFYVCKYRYPLSANNNLIPHGTRHTPPHGRAAEAAFVSADHAESDFFSCCILLLPLHIPPLTLTPCRTPTPGPPRSANSTPPLGRTITSLQAANLALKNVCASWRCTVQRQTYSPFSFPRATRANQTTRREEVASAPATRKRI